MSFLKFSFIFLVILQTNICFSKHICLQYLDREFEVKVINNNLLLANILFLNEDIYVDNMTLADVGSDIERTKFSFASWAELESKDSSKKLYLGLSNLGEMYAVNYDFKLRNGQAFKLSSMKFSDFMITNKGSILATNIQGLTFVYSINHMMNNHLAEKSVVRKFKVALRNSLEYSFVGLTAAFTLTLTAGEFDVIVQEITKAAPVWFTLSAGLSVFETLLELNPNKLTTQTGFIQYSGSKNITKWTALEQNDELIFNSNLAGIQFFLDLPKN